MDGDKYVFLFIDCLVGWGWLDLQDGWIELACRGVAGIDLRACESLGNYCQSTNYWQSISDRFPSHIRQCFSCEDDGIFDVGNNDGSVDGETAGDHASGIAGFAPKQQVSVSSKFTVPSQSQMEVDHSYDNEGGDTTVDTESMVGRKSEENEVEEIGQDEEEDNNNKDDYKDVDGGGKEDEEANILRQVALMCDQGVDPFHDFMPMYQGFCKMAKASGRNGLVCKNIMREGFNAMRSAMNRAVTDNDPPTGIAGAGNECIGIASLPEISRKRKAKRMKKVTSPARKGKKK